MMRAAEAPLARPVLCLGEILLDFIGEPVGPAAATEHFVPRVGGAPANVAVGLARLGVAAAFAGVVADDPFGPLLRERLESEQVDTRYIIVRPGAQSRLAAVTGPHGARGFTFYGHPAADSLLAPEDLAPGLIESAAALYLGSLPLATEPSRSAALAAVRRAAAAGVPVCFDPNPRPQLLSGPGAPHARRAIDEIAAAARVVKLSAHDLDVLGLSLVDLVHFAPSATLRVVTSGAEGCDYWIGDDHGHAAAIPVDPLDETGAGDAFTAALIARGVAAGFRYAADDVRFACAAGALATTRLGAMDALPTLAEVEDLMLERETDTTG